MKLSIVIPVFNEVLTLAETIRRVRAVPVDKELVVVDDCSTDGSGRVLESLRGPDMTLVRHPVNRGKGAAIRTATEHVTGDVVVIQDADLEYNPGELAGLLGYIERDEADVVYGSRFKGTHRSFMFSHYVGNKVLNLVTNALYNSCLTDMETCYKMMRADIFRSLELEANRFDIEPEITAKLLRRGWRLLEVPITYVGRDYGEGKKIRWTDGVAALWTLLKWRLRAPSTDLTLSEALERMHEHHRWVASWVRPHLGERLIHAHCGSAAVTRHLLDREAVLAVDPDPLVARRTGHLFRHLTHARVEALDLATPGSVARLREFRHDTVLIGPELAGADDAQELGRLGEALEPGTRLVLVVPAGGAPDALDRALGRERRYAAVSVEALLLDAGFELETLTWHNRLGAMGRRLATAMGPSPFAVQVYRTLVPLARRLDGAAPSSGDALVVVARRMHRSPA